MQDNLPKLIARNKGRIATAMGVSALLALAISLLMPRQFLSEAAMLAANSKMMDKQAIFGSNIQELYSAYGASDDLDRLTVTLQSPAVLQFVSDSLGLQQHYRITGKDARRKTIKKLERQMKITRSEYGELQIRVWDKDPKMAARIVELMISGTQQSYDRLFTDYYDTSIGRLQSQYELMSMDSAAAIPAQRVKEEEMVRSRITEMKIARANPPAAMFLVARPEVAVVADKPDILFNVAIALLAALFTMIAWITGAAFWKSAYATP
jgi:uncharacterized protein involved in exopolysaccharide biosynthesis